mgnify:CR=1 FL=1
MSVCCQCVKNTADSQEIYDKTIFVNISESYIEYDIFDTDESVVESNNYNENNDISIKITRLKLN